jgi:WD40 repeat protein
VAFRTAYELFLWDWRSGRFGATGIEAWPHENEQHSIALSSDGTRLAVGRSVGGVDLWMISRRPATLRYEDGNSVSFMEHEAIKEQKFEAHAGQFVKATKFVDDSSRLVTVANDGTAKIWDIEAMKASSRGSSHTGTISDLCISKTGRYSAVSSLNGTVRVFDVGRGSLLWRFKLKKRGATAVRISDDDSRVVTGWTNGAVRVFDTRGSKVSSIALGKASIAATEFGRESNQVISCSSNGWLHVWNTDDNSSFVLYEGNQSPGNLQDVFMALSEDRRFLAFSPTIAGNVYLWSLSPIEQITFLREELVSALAVSSGRGRLAVATADGEISLWCLEGKDRFELGRHDGVNRLAFSPDGKHLVSGAESQRFRSGIESVDVVLMNVLGPTLSESHIKIWHVESGRCLETVDGYGDVDAVAASLNELRAIVRGSETVVQHPLTSRDVAWFPCTPRFIRVHSESMTMVVALGGQLRILRLE